MKYTISAVKRTTLNKTAGGTWVKVECKLKETGDTVYEVNLNKYTKEKLAEGQVINGYISSRSWTGRNGTIVTPTFNEINAAYVYDLLLKMNPDIEKGGVTPTAESTVVQEENKNDNDW